MTGSISSKTSSFFRSSGVFARWRSGRVRRLRLLDRPGHGRRRAFNRGAGVSGTGAPSLHRRSLLANGLRSRRIAARLPFLARRTPFQDRSPHARPRALL